MWSERQKKKEPRLKSKAENVIVEGQEMEDRQFTPSGQRDEQTKEACSKEKQTSREEEQDEIRDDSNEVALCVCVSALEIEFLHWKWNKTCTRGVMR